MESLEPAGGTPLYDTIAEGVAKQQEGWEAGAVNALVILTDGDEHGSERDLEDLELSLSAADETKPVRVFLTTAFDAHCRELSSVLRRFGGACVKAQTPRELNPARRRILEGLGKLPRE